MNSKMERCKRDFRQFVVDNAGTAKIESESMSLLKYGFRTAREAELFHDLIEDKIHKHVKKLYREYQKVNSACAAVIGAITIDGIVKWLVETIEQSTWEEE